MNTVKKMAAALELLEPWKSSCDYRAEGDIQKAYELINEAMLAIVAHIDDEATKEDKS